MSVASERRRDSRLTENLGTLLVIVGALGIVASIGLSWWAIHDLGGNPSGSFATTAKIEIVSAVGITPGLLSVIVLAFGVYLQTRSTELLFGTVMRDDDPEATAGCGRH